MVTQRRNTRQRQLVLEAVRAHDDHPTADEIYVDLRANDPRISRGTVYRNLRLLSHGGEIRTFKVPGGDRFDWRVDDHAHVVCTGCGAVCDAPAPYRRELDEICAAQTGYRGVSHHTLFEGLCPACQAAEARAAETGQHASTTKGAAPKPASRWDKAAAPEPASPKLMTTEPVSEPATELVASQPAALS